MAPQAITSGIALVMGITLTGCINVVDKKVQEDGVSDSRRMAEADGIPVRGETAGRKCSAHGMTSYVGRKATAEIGTEIMVKSGSATLRWIRPDTVVTMDYRTDRVNVKLDNGNVITAINCG